MKNNDKYLIFLPACMLVKGNQRSVILDIQRGILDFVPNEIYDIFQNHNKQKVNYILSLFNTEEQEIVIEYFNFLFQNEYAILGTEHDSKHIVDLPTSYNYAGHITNCVLEYSDFIHKNITTILNETDKNLCCSAYQIIVSDRITQDNLISFLRNFNDLFFFSHIEIILPYSCEYDSKNIKTFLTEYGIACKITLYNSPFDKVDDVQDTVVVYTKQKELNCGVVAQEYFTQNMFHITEAKNFNSCLNKKISIDKEGNIKNCPFSKNNFGNILDSNILDTINSKLFQKYWHITKDKIKVCKDCEFRYICTDCRYFIKNKNDIYSQPANCDYNPYIAKWKGEDGYISVENYLQK